jgi:hypothetical protein
MERTNALERIVLVIQDMARTELWSRGLGVCLGYSLAPHLPGSTAPCNLLRAYNRPCTGGWEYAGKHPAANDTVVYIRPRSLFLFLYNLLYLSRSGLRYITAETVLILGASVESLRRLCLFPAG